MKLLVLLYIFVPLYMKQILSELLGMTAFLCMPILWKSWNMPMVASLDILIDKLSSILMVLTLWTSLLMILLKPVNKHLNLCIMGLLLSLILFFAVSNLLLFFILFEASLIPTLCLIMGWGYQPERIKASLYFIFYTIVMSIPLLVSLIWLTSLSGSKHFHFDTLSEVCSGTMSFLILSVFLVKLPMFMVHFWLPKAHVEAPVVGSMILAGVLLKTGGYGIVRVFLYMQKTLISQGFMILGLLGMVYICLICLCCVDLKQMIAFSSISHMNFMIVGLMNLSQTSLSGSTIMMVSHGLCSSLMFMLADLAYKRCSSRSILINKGLLMVAPILSMLWGFTVLFNMGVPPSAGSVSELLIISSTIYFMMQKVMFGLYLFLSAFYSVYLYMTVNHGSSWLLSNNLSVKEMFMSLSHLFPLAGLTMSFKILL